MTLRAVELLICGSPDRGDDGAAIAALDHLEDELLTLPLRVTAAGHLAVDELVRASRAGPVIIVDTAIGLRAGEVLELSFETVRRRATTIAPRSSHELPIADVIGLAQMLVARDIEGAVIVIGGQRFGFGDPLSPAVAAAIPALARKVADVAKGLVDAPA
jgi:hydrogenase maturation protease